MPFGFEPMGIYYNRDLVDTVPTLWETLPDILKSAVEEIQVPDSNDKTLLTVSSPEIKKDEKIAFTNL